MRHDFAAADLYDFGLPLPLTKVQNITQRSKMQHI